VNNTTQVVDQIEILW